MLMPFKWVPNAAETPRVARQRAPNLMTVISYFVQQSHNFIVAW